MTNEGFNPTITKPVDKPRFPVLEFTGKLDKFEGITQTFGEGNDTSTSKRVSFSFSDVTVIESSEPYPFDIIESLLITWNDGRPNTPWGAFSESVIEVTESEDIGVIVGKNQHWKWAPCRLNMPDPITGKWGIIEGMGWQLQSLEGFESSEAKQDETARVLAMADGKTDADFYKEFLADASFRKNEKLVQSATDRELLSSLEAGGMLSKDDEGIWHKA